LLAILSALEEAKASLAIRALTDPKSDPFQHGIEVGMYRGLEEAIKLIEDASAPKKSAAASVRAAVYS